MNENNNYCIYMHMNKINGKVYFGQTSQEPKKRWDYGYGYENCVYFYNAIQKYGWDGFYHIVLKDHLTLDEANTYEEELIKNYETQNHDIGYNIKSGGDNYKMTEETKKKISEAKKGEKNPRSKSVYCVELDKTFNCIREAERDLGVDHRNISGVCKGKRYKTAGGYHWKYADEQ